MEIKKQAWDNFMEAVDFESNTNNFKYEFKVMTKKYGQAYMEWCRNVWEINEGTQSKEDFCKMNANMLISYFDKVIMSKLS